MNKNKGFSLIELMVVIAIVAILAAVATPAYKTYITKTRLNMADNFVQEQINASVRYYNDNGVFGNVQQVGLPADPGNPDQNPDASVPGYLQGNVAQLVMSNNNTTTCKSGTADAYISNFGEGNAITDPASDIVIIQHTFIDVDGVIVKRCEYTYHQGGFIGGTTPSGSFVSNCANTVDEPGYAAATTALANSCS